MAIEKPRKQGKRSTRETSAVKRVLVCLLFLDYTISEASWFIHEFFKKFAQRLFLCGHAAPIQFFGIHFPGLQKGELNGMQQQCLNC
jgi:hypothetical protein